MLSIDTFLNFNESCLAIPAGHDSVVIIQQFDLSHLRLARFSASRVSAHKFNFS
jgi:hypothetical protein